jgi:hypothetical protein
MTNIELTEAQRQGLTAKDVASLPGVSDPETVTKADVEQFLALWDKLNRAAMDLLPLLAEAYGRTADLRYIDHVDRIERTGIDFYGYDGCDSVGFRLPPSVENGPQRSSGNRRRRQGKSRRSGTAGSTRG